MSLAIAANIAHEPWYHGSIPRNVAEELLESQPIGSFLFRESESRPGFSLSIKVADKVKHFMVTEKSPGKWALVGKQNEFSKVKELVEFHRTTPPSTTDGVCLVSACPKPGGENEDENPYVDLVDDGVNHEVMLTVKKLSEAKLKDAKKDPKVHPYENFALESQ